MCLRQDALAPFHACEMRRTVRANDSEEIIIHAPALSLGDAIGLGLLQAAKEYYFQFPSDRIELRFSDSMTYLPACEIMISTRYVENLLQNTFPAHLFAKVTISTKPTILSPKSFMVNLWDLSEKEQDEMGAYWMAARDRVLSVEGLVVGFAFTRPEHFRD